MFNFEVYTLLQAIVNCRGSILVHGRKDSGVQELLYALYDAKKNNETTLYVGATIQHLYPMRKIVEINDPLNSEEVADYKETTAVINGLSKQHIRLYIDACKNGQGMASLEGKTLNFPLDEVEELLIIENLNTTELDNIDFVLIVEAHKLISLSEIVRVDGKATLHPLAEFVGVNEYTFYSDVSEAKLTKMRNNDYEEAERFYKAICTYEDSSK